MMSGPSAETWTAAIHNLNVKECERWWPAVKAWAHHSSESVWWADVSILKPSRWACLHIQAISTTAINTFSQQARPPKTSCLPHSRMSSKKPVNTIEEQDVMWNDGKRSEHQLGCHTRASQLSSVPNSGWLVHPDYSSKRNAKEVIEPITLSFKKLWGLPASYEEEEAGQVVSIDVNKKKDQ